MSKFTTGLAMAAGGLLIALALTSCGIPQKKVDATLAAMKEKCNELALEDYNRGQRLGQKNAVEEMGKVLHDGTPKDVAKFVSLFRPGIEEIVYGSTNPILTSAQGVTKWNDDLDAIAYHLKLLKYRAKPKKASK